MWGAIIGDLAGSIYEYSQIKQVTPVRVNNLIEENSFYSDDTILTIAVLDAMLNDKKFDYYLRKYGKDYIQYKPNFEPYFKDIFSPGFIKWLKDTSPGCSMGNGAMMRISSVGYLSSSEEEVIKYARLATIPSHNCPESIALATTVAMIIFLARKEFKKERIIDRLHLHFEYQPFTKFNVTCPETINNCLYALFTSDNFDESLRKVISYGGDTDTNACIVGSMAEALYGVDAYLIEEAKSKIPDEFIRVLNKGYTKANGR